jgi:hypothetical protein
MRLPDSDALVRLLLIALALLIAGTWIAILGWAGRVILH